MKNPNAERFLMRLPRVSANEDRATLLEWAKSEGDPVRAGEILCVIETTKSLFDVEAEADGRLFPLLEAGQSAEVGDPLAVLSRASAETREAVLAWVKTQRRGAAIAGEPEQGKTGSPGVARPQPGKPGVGGAATKKAEILAARHGIELRRIPASGERITEADVLAYLKAGSEAPPAAAPPAAPAAVQRILILGGGDGAVQVLDAVGKTPGQRGVAILDDNPALHGRSIMGVPVLGPLAPEEIVRRWRAREFDAAVISISTLIPLRRRLFEELTARGVPFANVIHPTTCLGAESVMGSGNVILAFCHIGACAEVGDNNFLSAYVSIEHHNRLGSHCSFGPGVFTSSRVITGDGTRFGTGIFIEPKIVIGEGSIIGSGAILRNDLPPGSVVKTRLHRAVRPGGG